ncbi:hypothetical protein PA08_0140 [Cutibacterium modestum P08]|nr:hypothetical protein PA08_0140 [Cutibacterium modestum P08]
MTVILVTRVSRKADEVTGRSSKVHGGATREKCLGRQGR